MDEISNVGVSEALNFTSKDPQDDEIAFLIQTTSTFSNVYAVRACDAKSQAEAIDFVMNSSTPPDFVQAHQGEKIINIIEVKDSEANEQLMRRFPNYA